MTHRDCGNTGMFLTQANRLDASSQLYNPDHSQDTIVHTVGHALPAALHGYVQTVVPTAASLPRPTPFGHRVISLVGQ